MICVNNDRFRYTLAGIIYYHFAHFTARVIHEGNIWYHDGLMGETMEDQGNLLLQADLYHYKRQQAVSVIYKLSSQE